ncbi:hypothetical protein BaRGS_00021215 [Batillaria attramentaria]|uniref:Uncharacterized protein n=1 Tax=Batillaria attramentaria TaxID=370345 RepID=A0ABD0KK71_9CAEN
MLISCTFGGNKCFSGNVSSYFTREWTMDFGNCYTMNTSGMHVYDSGAAAGLDLIFNLETEESLTTYLTGYGMCVVVHERGTQPFPSADGLSASAGFQTHFSLQASEVSRLSGNYGHCSHSDASDSKYEYSLKTCHAERYEGRQMETCNCTDPFSRTSTPSRNASICETAEEFECNARVKEEFKDIVSQEKPYFDCYNPCR